MQLLLISDVLPNNQSGGSIVLKRHIEAFPGKIDLWQEPLQRTWFSKLGHKLWDILGANKKRNLPYLERYLVSSQLLVRAEQADAILTVAHRRTCFLAQKVASKVNKPLISIFHDYYPATECTNSAWRTALDKEFKELYLASRLCFMVSDGMLQHMGRHPNAHLLYPLPRLAHKENGQQSGRQTEKLSLLYSGNARGKYQQILLEFTKKLANFPQLELSICSNDSTLYDGLDYVKTEPFIPEQAYAERLLATDVLLLLISDAPEETLHYQTQFPSKFIDYINSPKPIVVFAPEYSSLAYFLNKHKPQGVYIFHPKAMLEGLKFLSQNFEQMREEALQRQVYSFFQPQHIMAQFNERIKHCLKG